MYKVLSAESCSGGHTQPAAVAANQNPPSKILIKKPSHQKKKKLESSFRESFIYSGKQGGGAVVLREGCDIVTRETCVPTSLNINNLGKAAVLHFALFHSWGHTKLSLQIIGHNCAYVKFS
jgi:hypothetical protein